MRVSAMLSREDYERLEKQFAAEQQFFGSWTEKYPLLEEIIAGKTSFAEKEVELFAGYQRHERLGLDFASFVDMVEDLAESKFNIADRMLLDAAILIFDIPPEKCTQEDLFRPIAEACADLDRRIRRCYGLAFLRQSPEAFEEFCSGMEPAEREYARMKMLEQLGAESAAFGKALGSLCERHPFVQEIMDGKATFADTARSLEQRFGEMLPSRSERRKLAGDPLEARSRQYMEQLITFTGMVDSLTGEKRKYEFLGFHEVVDYSVCGITVEAVGMDWDMHAFVNEEFERYTQLSEELDKRVCLYLAPHSVTEAPDRFREAYAAAHPLEREYVKDMLLRAVGAGAVRDMGEDELLRFLASIDK